MMSDSGQRDLSGPDSGVDSGLRPFGVPSLVVADGSSLPDTVAIVSGSLPPLSVRVFWLLVETSVLVIRLE